MTQQSTKSPQFFLTAAAPCPYLSDQFERKVFTHIVGDKAPELNDLLTQGGFRRSQNIAYRPACEACQACVSVRILAQEFVWDRSMRRIYNKNKDLVSAAHEAEPSSEQYSLFRTYLDSRHPDGGMSEMSVLDYAMMIEDSHVNTEVIEYRIRDADTSITGKSTGQLVGVALTDIMADGMSMVYSFFDPGLHQRSLGTFMILDHIERVRKRGLSHLYLGYWVEGSQKMTYKTRFKPQEHLGLNGWKRADL